jgi:hypothetical protein
MTCKIDGIGSVFAALVLWDKIQSEEANDDAKKDVFYEGCGCT